jgi:hypothetical protein
LDRRRQQKPLFPEAKSMPSFRLAASSTDRIQTTQPTWSNGRTPA